MSARDKLVVVIAGYTKSGKTRLAHVLAMYTGWDMVEMSDGIRHLLPHTDGLHPSKEIISNINKLRRAEGQDVLARRAAQQVLATQSDVVVLAGLRSAADYAYLRSFFPNVVVIFAHVTTSLRHQYMRDDPDSIATTDEDFAAIDTQTSGEDIASVAQAADYMVINEPGYALTPYEQLWEIVRKIAASQPKRPMGWARHPIDPVHYSAHLPSGYLILTGSAMPSPHEGEGNYRASENLATVAGAWNSAYGQLLHGNHFHEETQERLEVTSGEISCSLRRATLVEEEPVTIRVSAGQILVVRPGWTHLYSATQPRTTGILRKWSLDLLRADVIEDPIFNSYAESMSG